MEIRHLRYFIAVAEELHFARAAERLHIEVSPLSRAIKELEEKLGIVLFVRTTRSTRLTRAGQLFLEHARRVIAALLGQKRDNAQRRKGMDDLVPREGIHRANQSVAIAQAEQRRAQVALDLERTTLRAPVDGYVTHLRLHQGDYAVAGHPNIALLDAHSFWITGYFEETKLRGIRPGAPAQIRLMGFDDLIHGHVASIGRGITDANEQADAQGLPSVEPSFSWVRLAQRIPVRVEIDQLPASIVLAAGMTCSIEVGQPGHDPVPQGRLTTLLHRWM